MSTYPLKMRLLLGELVDHSWYGPKIEPVSRMCGPSMIPLIIDDYSYVIKIKARYNLGVRNANLNYSTSPNTIQNIHRAKLVLHEALQEIS